MTLPQFASWRYMLSTFSVQLSSVFNPLTASTFVLYVYTSIGLHHQTTVLKLFLQLIVLNNLNDWLMLLTDSQHADTSWAVYHLSLIAHTDVAHFFRFLFTRVTFTKMFFSCFITLPAMGVPCDFSLNSTLEACTMLPLNLFQKSL